MRKLTAFLVTMAMGDAFAVGVSSTDGTVGAVQNLGSASFTVPQSLGTTIGNNLFHSFSQFNVNTGQTATFTGSSQLQNVISRVTGGQVSNIDGTIKSAVGKADFYFINPAGIVFGQNAIVDVPAAFHISTADQLLFKDGVAFSAVASGGSGLSSATPTEFGFLGTSTKHNGLLAVYGSQLTAKPRQSIDFVAGTIDIKSSETQNAQLNAESGAIRLAALQGEGKITVDTFSLPTQKPTAENAGNIAIDGRSNSVTSNDTRLSTTGNGGGNLSLWGSTVQFLNAYALSDNTGIENPTQQKLTVRANLLSLDNSTLSFSANSFANTNTGNAGDVDIQVQTLNMIKSEITSSTWTNGNAGSVNIVTDSLKIDGQNRLPPLNIPPNTLGSGNADVVKIAPDNLTLADQGSGISSDAKKGSSGNAGRVNIQAKTVDILNGGLISSETSANGHAGTVIVEANALNIEGNVGGISSDAKSNSSGKAGTVIVKADNLKIDAQGGAQVISAGIFSNAYGDGDAGTVDIQTKTLDILNQGLISSSTRSRTTGKAGAVKVTSDHLTINGRNTGISSNAHNGSGDAGSVNVKANTLDILNGGRVSSETFTSGNAGTVIVEANDLKIEGNRSIISSDSREGSSGGAGIVIVTADHLNIDAQAGDDLTITAGIVSSTFGSGDAGQIQIKANTLNIAGGGIISSKTFANGNAGTVNVETDDLKIEGDGSGITSNAREGSRGNAGNVNVKAKTLDILDGGIISTETYTNGNAGKVTVQANDLNIKGHQGGISSDAKLGSSGKAGTVEVMADTLTIDGSTSQANGRSPGIFTNTFGSGDAGNVDVKAKTLAILNRGKISSNTWTTGKAGTVTVKTDTLKIDGQGQRPDQNQKDFTGISSSALLNPPEIEPTQPPTNSGQPQPSSSLAGSGQTGNVFVSANQSIEILNKGSIRATNEGVLSDTTKITSTQVTVTAPDISLTNGSEISTDSSGNVAASHIEINATKSFSADASFVTTTANSGNGGVITVNGQNALIRLKDSGLITTVKSADGNGGNININSDILLMDTAVIQANAQSGNGGEINLKVNALIPTGNMLIKGGKALKWQAKTFGFNLIQAASATGINGVINSSAPQLNLSGVLTNFGKPQFESNLIEQNDCEENNGSSLTRVGNGGLPRKRSEL